LVETFKISKGNHMRNVIRTSSYSLSLGFVIICLLQTVPQVASSQPLAVAHVQNGTVGRPSIITSLSVYFGSGENTNAVLFSQFTLTPADVGRTFILDASNDPDFAAVKMSLENGIPNAVVFGDGLGFTMLTSEANFFNPLPVGSNGFDFQGFSIGSIALTVDSLTFTSPGTNPNGNGNWTDIHFRGTIGVYAVPEPSGLTLLGIAGLFFRRFITNVRRSSQPA
jgi:hypothetical protein